jgi:hypothetical protein
MKTVPGRKTYVKDAEWIAKLIAHSLVQPRFVPPQPIRQLRDLACYRTEVVCERTREARRLNSLLEDAGIKITSVASDVLGKSRCVMVKALVADEHDPQTSSELAPWPVRWQTCRPDRRTDRAVRRAPRVSRVHHARPYRHRHCGARPATARIGSQVQPYRRRVELLACVPGVSEHTRK